MLAIQDVGKQIMSGNPLKFYVMLGTEYGIKERYIDILKDRYGGDFVEYSSVMSIISLMKQRHLIPLSPMLYIVRYDEDFVSNLDRTTEGIIESLNIIGTVVCIYEDLKHCKKLSNYLPNFSVSIDPVNSKFIHKYLMDEFTELDEGLISLCVQSTDCYSQARNMCRSVSYAPEAVKALDESDVTKLFGTTQISSDSQLRIAIAMRSVNYAMSILDSYDSSYDSAIYVMLSTMIELEKLNVNKYAESDIRKFVGNWNLRDIYYFFNNCYYQLNQLRSAYAVDGKLIVTYLISLLAFNEIPDGGNI